MAAVPGRPARRPELYQPLAEPVEVPPAPVDGRDLTVAVPAPPSGASPDEVASVVADAVAGGADLVLLSELAGVAGSSRRQLSEGGPAGAAEDGAALLAELASALAGTDAHAVTSVVEVTHEGPALVGVAVGAGGVALHQPALHRSPRHDWPRVLGDRQKVLALPQGGLAVVVGDDLLLPETGRLAVLGGATVLACPAPAAGEWPVGRDELVRVRAAELGVEVVVAGPDGWGSGAAADTVPRVCLQPPSGTPTAPT